MIIIINKLNEGIIITQGAKKINLSFLFRFKVYIIEVVGIHEI